MTTYHERLAAAATPGPWKAKGRAVVVSKWAHGDLFIWDTNQENNAALVAACPPEMVQAWENGMKAARLAKAHVPAGAGAWVALDEALTAYDARVAALQEDNDE